ncbi:PREDICTED: protein bicaudal C homolog 1-like [Tarenaya hassleriana]|uniref:protein bicaudal C homolog 1-like n=1 Tax=Tarenaya hassleriana TaxID=28532 RepID=UPI00053C3983|nr:PREDICTED: protein bicaudal C homolog 1-like [Tarenaya hassleriana]
MDAVPHQSSEAPLPVISAASIPALPPPPPKRNRRPSVRLGDIGDQPAALSYDSHVRRTKPQNFPPWRNHKDPSSSKSSVKARSITNLVNGNRFDHPHAREPPEERNNQNDNGRDGLDFGYRKAKARRGTTRQVRSNWVSSSAKPDNEGSNSREEGEDGFRNFDPDYDSPVQSLNNEPLDVWNGQRRSNPDLGRARVSNNELDYNPRESDSRGNNNEGVMSWLIELGLSRYAPVFEIHEVDDEVLPMLTLEDLKDMGISAVGSRRKLYAAIEKLRRGLS